VPVTDITGIPAEASAGTGLVLSGTVAPVNAANKTIVWSVKTAGTTGATISGSTLNTAEAGTVTVTATITNGLSSSADYTKDFDVTVSKSAGAAVSGVPAVNGTPTHGSITVNAVTNLSGNGQIVEYAISVSNTELPISGWQESTTFIGLAANTTYYVYARTAESGAYHAGIAQHSGAIKTSVIPVVNIADVQTAATAGTNLTLTGTVEPDNATNKTIVWSVKNAGTTGATINNSILNTTASGTVVVTGTITNGATNTSDYMQDFYITVNKNAGAAVSGAPAVSGTPTSSSITVNAVTNQDGNGQTVEYAIGTSSSAPTSEYQTATTFGDLLPNTTYYVFARTAASGIYAAGTPQISAAIKTAIIPVADITGVQTAATAKAGLVLTATVFPANATNKTISWSVKEAGTTGATISGSTLNTAASGKVTVTATITNGLSSSEDYTKDFVITVSNQYIVTFHPNTGTVSEESRLVASGEAIGELPTPTKASHIFLGWYTQLTGGTKITAETLVTGHVTHYAQWTPAWKVTWSAKGGEASKASQLVQKKKAIGTLPTNTRTGYTFKGWYTKTSGGTKITTKTVPTKDVTYYAQWKIKQYKASFKANGGKANKTSIKKNYNSKIGTLPTATRTGYKFLGWYTETTGGTKIKTSTKITQNMVCYAQWEIKQYTVKFNAAGGKVSSPSLKKDYNKTIETLPTAAKSGNIFDGWYTAKSGGSKVKASTKITKNVTYYAHWTAAWTVKFDSNVIDEMGPVENPPTKLVKKKAAVGTLDVLSQDGYVFSGWYTKASGGMKINTTTKPTKDVTYYAHWTVDETA
jgi:uncharacterized repeat protein (TIGR02543 family)